MADKPVITLKDTLLELSSTATLKPRDLLKAVRKTHPSARKKEVIWAAFECVIELADRRPQTARQLQDFAIASRGDGEE